MHREEPRDENDITTSENVTAAAPERYQNLNISLEKVKISNHFIYFSSILLSFSFCSFLLINTSINLARMKNCVVFVRINSYF